MSYYSYSIAGAATAMTGGGGQPSNRQGTIRSMTVNNGLGVAVTLSFYDSSVTSPLTTNVAAYDTFAYVSADAYGYYAYGTTPRDAVGTPFFSSATTYTPPTGAPSGTGLPASSPAESQDYQAVTGVYTLRKYKGTKTDTTTVAANASTALVPFFTVIVPAGSVQYIIEGPWSYVSGIVAASSTASVVQLVAVID
jgi:hypothetical protein